MISRAEPVHLFPHLSLDDGNEVRRRRVPAAEHGMVRTRRWGVWVTIVIFVVANDANSRVPWDWHQIITVGCVYPEVGTMSQARIRLNDDLVSLC